MENIYAKEIKKEWFEAYYKKTNDGYSIVCKFHNLKANGYYKLNFTEIDEDENKEFPYNFYRIFRAPKYPYEQRYKFSGSYKISLYKCVLDDEKNFGYYFINEVVIGG